METLNCSYGGSITYQPLPPDDLGGINSLYSSQYLAQRDTNFFRVFTATTHGGSETLYKLYSSAIQRHYWPELIDVRDTTATWLVTCSGPHHDSALTMARTLVALDARWSIVGLLSFGDFGIVLKGRLTDAQVVSLERWEFPAGLLKIGNPTALFRGKASSNVRPSTESESHFNQSSLPTASAVAEARITNDAASGILRGITEGPSSSHDTHNDDDNTSWPQPQLLPFEDETYATSDDESDSDTLSSHFSSDEEEEQLPSYRHASRRLARERRLLAQDPSEVEDPAGTAVPCRDVVLEEEEEEFEVPPTYHDRGEGAPDYVEVTGSEEAPEYIEVAGSEEAPTYTEMTGTHDWGRDEAPTGPQAHTIQGSPPSYLFLPVISEEILPDYETVIELDTPSSSPTTSTYFRQEDSNSLHSSIATLHGSLLGTASPRSALEPRRTRDPTHTYGPSMASNILPVYPPSSPQIYQPRLSHFSPLSSLQNQNQTQIPNPPPTSPTAPNTTTALLVLESSNSPPTPPPPPHSIHHPPAHSLSIRTIRTPAPTQRFEFQDWDTGPPYLRLLSLIFAPFSIPTPPHTTPPPHPPPHPHQTFSLGTTSNGAYGGISMPTSVSIRIPNGNRPLASVVPSREVELIPPSRQRVRSSRGQGGSERAGARARVGLYGVGGSGTTAVPAPAAVARVSNRHAELAQGRASTARLARMETSEAGARD